MQQAAELSVAAPTITSSLDGRFMSGLKDERVSASQFYKNMGIKETQPEVESTPPVGLSLHWEHCMWKTAVCM